LCVCASQILTAEIKYDSFSLPFLFILHVGQLSGEKERSLFHTAANNYAIYSRNYTEILSTVNPR
jgi:hypothetical protein